MRSNHLPAPQRYYPAVRPLFCRRNIRILILFVVVVVTSMERASATAGDFDWTRSFDNSGAALDCRVSLEDMNYGSWEMSAVVRIYAPDSTLIASDAFSRVDTDYISARRLVDNPPGPGTYHCFVQVSAWASGQSGFADSESLYFTIN